MKALRCFFHERRTTSSAPSCTLAAAMTRRQKSPNFHRVQSAKARETTSARVVPAHMCATPSLQVLWCIGYFHQVCNSTWTRCRCPYTRMCDVIKCRSRTRRASPWPPRCSAVRSKIRTVKQAAVAMGGSSEGERVAGITQPAESTASSVKMCPIEDR